MHQVGSRIQGFSRAFRYAGSTTAKIGTTTHDIGHPSPRRVACSDEGLLARIVEAEREKEKADRGISRQRIHGITAGAPPTVGQTVIEMAQKYDVTLVACLGLLEDEAPTTFTVKSDGPFGDFDLENLQKAIGKRRCSGRFIKGSHGAIRFAVGSSQLRVVVRISDSGCQPQAGVFETGNVARSRNAKSSEGA